MFPRSLILLTAASLFLIFNAPGALADDEECLGCHAPAEDVVDVEYQVDPDAFVASIHAEMGFGCADCHPSIGDYPHEGDELSLACGTCHDQAHEDVLASAHGEVAEFGSDACGVCHSDHAVRAVSDPASMVSIQNQPATCAGCHADYAVMGVEGRDRLDAGTVFKYEHSVHGMARDGHSDQTPAVCSDCHNGHRVMCACEADASTNPFHINETCGQCHENVVAEYTQGAHWRAFHQGRTLSPTCTTCHGIHTIKHVPDADATETEARSVRNTCIACHGSEALMGNLGVAPARVSSYDASYHGLVHKRGEAAVADCASCHGVHAILPSSNPNSMVAPERLQETCGHCHPGAGTVFVQTPVHFLGDAETADTGTLIVIWVKRIYWALLIGVLGGMFIHNLIIVSWYMRRKWHAEKGKRLRRRFSTSQVIQHAMLVTSFFVLVISGFMLAYPDAWWARMLADVGIGEWTRRYVHRTAAVVMIVASFIHLYWMLFTPYGRAEVKRIAPKMRDVREVMQNMRFHLGTSRQRAAFAKYDYPAKAEYWALVWGTVVMALTGMILWFPVFTTSFAPSWILKVAEVIGDPDLPLLLRLRSPRGLSVQLRHVPRGHARRARGARASRVVRGRGPAGHLSRPHEP
jgi:cytochrome b subunit of formate dehydrogenase